MADQAFEIKRMTGRCSNGFERDGGKRWHAVAGDRTGWGRAVCGATPGARGNGWSETRGARVTCPRCVARLAVAPPAVATDPLTPKGDDRE